MGYSYGRTSRGGQALACDHCGESEGRTRKRTCPHKVRWDSLRSVNGERHEVSYCQPPAYCPDCLRAAGGSKAIHKDCAEAAAKATAGHDAIEAGLDAGEAFVIAAWGRGADVPEGQCKVIFKGRKSEKSYFIPTESYDPRGKPKLSDYPEAVAT
jgi:hypothetical protein